MVIPSPNHRSPWNVAITFMKAIKRETINANFHQELHCIL
jgi:hypothetical protein